jgi:hypothetical protein
MSKPSLREQMPDVTRFIDSMRDAFGKDMIDGQIRRGMKGEPTFWASENRHEIGTRNRAARSLVSWDDMGRSYSFDIPAGTSPEQEADIRRAALKMANARVFNRRGLVVGDGNAE